MPVVGATLHSLQAPEAAPSIVEFIARAHRRRSRRTVVEAVSLGLASAALATAAALLSIAPASHAAANLSALAACAALCGLAAASTWWVERAKKTDLELSRQIDVRLESDGALSTAYEARARGDQSPIARRLEERVLAALDRSSLVRALPGPGWIWLAPPAIGMALVALVLEAPVHREATNSAPGIGFDPGSSAISRARSALERARKLQALEANDPRMHAQSLTELAAAAAELDRASDTRALDGARAASVGESNRELAAARAELEAGRRAAAGDVSRDQTARIGAAATPAAGAGAGTGQDAAGSLLTKGSPDRTMSGSNRSTAAANDSRPTPGEPSGFAPEAGTIAGRWWPERSDPVVQGWRRALAARAEQH